MGPVIGNGQKKAYLEIFLKFYFILIRERGSGEKGREREIGRENEKEKGLMPLMRWRKSHKNSKN